MKLMQKFRELSNGLKRHLKNFSVTIFLQFSNELADSLQQHMY